ncbi:cytochrome P450 6g1-like [Cochliomyia hominivorax]
MATHHFGVRAREWYKNDNVVFVPKEANSLNFPELSINEKIFGGKFFDFLTFKTNFSYHAKSLYEDERYKHESVIGIYGLYQPGLLIREPEIIKNIFIKDFDCFRNRSCIGDTHRDPLGAMTLFFASYPFWREMRLKLRSIFSSGNLKLMYPLLQKVGESLEQFLKRKGECFTVELKQLSGRYTTDVISTTIMGFQSNALENDQEFIYQEAIKLGIFNFKRAFDFLIMFFAPKLNWIFKPKVFYHSTEQFLRSSISRVMEERERLQGQRNDLIDAFVKIKQQADEKNEQISMNNLYAQAGILMTGGYETSSTTLANALFELAKDQQVQETLRQEILKHSEEDGEISYDTLNKMSYLQMIVDEILRMYPVLPLLDRRYQPSTYKSTEFSLQPYYDYKLPNDMPVYIPVFGLHYDPKYWPDPLKFDPERFNAVNKKLLRPCTYLPFGDGPRNCIGARLGLLQVQVGLVYFLKNFSVEICSETNINSEFEPKSIALQIKGGIHLRFIRDDLCDRFNRNKF